MNNTTLVKAGGFSSHIPGIREWGTSAGWGDVHGNVALITTELLHLERIWLSKEGYAKLEANYKKHFQLLPELPRLITQLAEGKMSPKVFKALTGRSPTQNANDLKTKGRSYAQDLVGWLGIDLKDIKQIPIIHKKLFGSLNEEQLRRIHTNINEYLRLIQAEIQAPLAITRHPATTFGDIDEPLFSLGDHFNDRGSDLQAIPLIHHLMQLLNKPNQSKQFRQLWSNHAHRSLVHTQEKNRNLNYLNNWFETRMKAGPIEIGCQSLPTSLAILHQLGDTELLNSYSTMLDDITRSHEMLALSPSRDGKMILMSHAPFVLKDRKGKVNPSTERFVKACNPEGSFAKFTVTDLNKMGVASWQEFVYNANGLLQTGLETQEPKVLETISWMVEKRLPNGEYEAEQTIQNTNISHTLHGHTNVQLIDNRGNPIQAPKDQITQNIGLNGSGGKNPALDDYESGSDPEKNPFAHVVLF